MHNYHYVYVKITEKFKNKKLTRSFGILTNILEDTREGVCSIHEKEEAASMPLFVADTALNGIPNSL